jgi:hypothetical protein
MKPMDRRRFLLATAATAASLQSFAQDTPKAATLTLYKDKSGPAIPSNFVGLSYETQQLSDPHFFSPANTGLVAQFRALAPHGVLRIGGNTSDVGWWKPTPESKQPPLPPDVVIVPLRPDEQPFQKLAYAITPEAVRNLRAFLDATEWTCLYGINLGTNTPALAAEQAVYVAKTLGPRLEYFQVGNEPDGFSNRFRNKATWNADAYFDEWLAAANAIRERVPHATFGLPDVASHASWATTVANRLAAMPDRPNIAAITHHHYFGGPPSNPNVNITRLLQPQENVLTTAATVKAAAQKLGTLFRMTEGNTCYRGGKPGVSDVFAATLWAADYLLLLASLGYAGANLHGGSGKAVADSLGGTLPGELLMANPKAPHPRPFYTPIAEIDGKYVAEPVYYGLKFAQQFAGATIVPIDFDPGPVNATAYAAKRANGQFVLAIINKDQSRALNIKLPGFIAATILRAPSLSSHSAEMTSLGGTHETSTVPPACALLLCTARVRMPQEKSVRLIHDAAHN